MAVNKLCKTIGFNISCLIMLAACSPSEPPLHEWNYTRGAFDAALSKDGEQALIAPVRDNAQYWEVNAPSPKFTFKHQKNPETNPITKVAIAKEAPIGLTALPSQLAVWDLTTGQNLRFLALPETQSQILSLEISTHGQYALVGFSGTKAILINLVTGQIMRVFKLEDSARTLAFSNSGQYVLIGSDDTSIQLWDLNTGQIAHQWSGTGHIQTVAFSDDDSLILASTSFDDAVIYNTKTGQKISTLISSYGLKYAKGANGVSAAKFTQNNDYVITGAPPRSIRVFNVASGKQVQEFNMPKNAIGMSTPAFVLSLTLSKSQDKIIALSSNGKGYEYNFRIAK